MGNGEGIRRDAVGDGETGNIRSVDGKRIEGIPRGRGVAREKLVVAPKVVIEPEAPLIVVVAPHLRGLVNGWGDVPKRVQIPGGQPNGTEQHGRNLIARKGHARKFIDQGHRLTCAWIGQAGEVPGSLGGGGYDSGLSLPLVIALPLVVEEEEILVAPERAAQCRPKLIQVQRLGCGGKEVAGIGRVVPQKIIDVAMKILATVLGDYRSSHTLNLGQKSQQIGGVLDIINELAEQTNILSINATIEAAGAGEYGKRFAVVGDEIRKLADRVAGSTKEIRALVEEIHTAVNTTILATEMGSKAVDAGLHRFEEVTRGFKEIAGMVGTTTQAAREIGLSNKQQMTAVEQDNAAISGAAQATREAEASATQTLQTATQLAQLSHRLSRLVQSRETV